MSLRHRSGSWILLIALWLSASLLPAGEEGPIRLIIMADDLGAAEAVNRATFAAYRDGVVTTSNVIVPGPWFPQAVRLANENPKLDLGIHIALTSEWTDVKWRPLTGGRSFCDEDGYFAAFVWPNPKAAPARALRELKVDLAEAEVELRAQIVLAKRHIPRVSYLWPHMAFTSHSPEMLALVRKLAKEYDIPLFSDVMEAQGIKRLKSLYTSKDSAEQKTTALVKAIEGLTPGTWVLVDHAADDTQEMRAIGHVGYENVAVDRDGNRAMWLDPKVKDVIASRRVALTSAATVVAEWKQRP